MLLISDGLANGYCLSTGMTVVDDLQTTGAFLHLTTSGCALTLLLTEPTLLMLLGSQLSWKNLA